MSKDSVEITHHQTFESLREEQDGCEFWSARKLSKALEYYEYRNFLPVVEKAKEACKNSGQAIEDHFVQVNEMVENRERTDPLMLWSSTMRTFTIKSRH